jgi:carbonic anhydrase/acetyltransferase-like protein (isoleucine patch superfamily)
VLRGDNDRITVGENSNIQDGSALHVDPGFPLTVGRDVTIGHMVMLHGCTIGDGCLVGIGAIILNGVTVGQNCLIGANAFLPEGKEIPDDSVVLGAPGKIVRAATDKDRAMMARPVPGYVRRWSQYRDKLRPLG